VASKATVVHVDTDELPAPQVRRFMELVGKANAGDEAALRELRPMLDMAPKLAAQMGDLAEMTRGAWVTRITGGQLAMAEAIGRTVDGLRAELTQPSDGPLERLLIDRVALCWLHLHYAEGAYAQKMDGLDAEWSEHSQRRIDRAQRRYLQAIRTLAQVRRLAVPAAVQINVAEHQVNQMGAGVRTVA
jgi:hypothetical protein